MAKHNSTIGKLLAFATTVAAVGGVCYVFRDQIKESPIYQKSKDKLSQLREKMSEKLGTTEEDFPFDEEWDDDYEEDVFSEEAKNNREYTSITINSKEEANVADTLSETNEEMKEIFAEDSIPTIAFGVTEKKEDVFVAEDVLGYENEGLSDVEEEPDTLEEQDKLDF